MTDIKEKKTRTPRNFDSILLGATALTIKEKVDLKNAIMTQITNEVTAAEENAKQARAAAGL